MNDLIRNRLETPRHVTEWLEAGPSDGPVMIFLHGWPGLSITWRRQMEELAAAGWRCVAPDMRGYGGSSAPPKVAAYALAEIVEDMKELHDALGGGAAVWVGHDWGAAVVWTLAAHCPERCQRIAAMGMPYIPNGFALDTLIALADRETYPPPTFPAAQWDYWLYQIEHYDKSTHELQRDVRGALNALYQRSPPLPAGTPSPLAGIRRQGGWFGPEGQTPDWPRDMTLMSENDFAELVEAYTHAGFGGPNAWYLNSAANVAFASTAPNEGRISLPALFIHSALDLTCATMGTRLAQPMLAKCDDLNEQTIEAGHHLMLEDPIGLNRLLRQWVDRS